jgi:malonate decarboxylase beta subunit
MSDPPAILARNSFIELGARERAFALLDPGNARELCGPFDETESPWLVPQSIVPQSDDGVVVVKGALEGRPVVVIGIEQSFQGGGIGEVSGTKVATALSLAAADNRRGTPTSAVLLLETGGVRLQEANLGLATVAEICAALLELREHRPVVGVIAGSLGSFGGMSIAAGLCSALIMTQASRLGLNGPDVIESEAGIEEFDANDHADVWAVTGGIQRVRTGLADALVADDVEAIRAAAIQYLTDDRGGPPRSRQLDVLRDRLERIDPARAPAPADLAAAWGLR